MLGTQDRVCALTETETLPCLGVRGVAEAGLDQAVKGRGDGSCAGDLQVAVWVESPRWGRPEAGLIPRPNLSHPYLEVAVFPAHVVTAMHRGKRSSPRRHGQEAQRGRGWLERAWPVFSHHPLGPGDPETALLPQAP